MGNGGEGSSSSTWAKPVRIIDLAKRMMIQLSGAKNVKVRFTGLHCRREAVRGG